MKFLVFQHVPHEPPGMLSEAAKKKKIEMYIVELWKPYTIPAAENFDALIIMGGPMGVYEGPEQYPSKEDELGFIRANTGKLPMIGFCLGAQLIAHALGAEVYSNLSNGRRVKEVGFSTVDLTEEGERDPLFADFVSPVTVLQLHGDAFELPEGATLLARSSVCQNQAFRSGTHTYGALFHSEFTPKMMDELIAFNRQWLHKDFEIDEETLRAEARSSASKMRAQCEQLFDNFCSIIARD